MSSEHITDGVTAAIKALSAFLNEPLPPATAARHRLNAVPAAPAELAAK